MLEDISVIIDRLKKSVVNSGLSYVELEKVTGIPKSTIQRYTSGSTKKIPVDAIGLIAKAVGVSSEFILGFAENDTYGINNSLPLARIKAIPLIGTIACGAPLLAEENTEAMLALPEGINADFALRCKGDSMTGARINNNDIVYIKQQETVENGEIAAVLIDTEATLKRFYRYGNTVVLRAENPSFKEIEYKNEELNSIKVLGKAVCFRSEI